MAAAQNFEHCDGKYDRKKPVEENAQYRRIRPQRVQRL